MKESLKLRFLVYFWDGFLGTGMRREVFGICVGCVGCYVMWFYYRYWEVRVLVFLCVKWGFFIFFRVVIRVR